MKLFDLARASADQGELVIQVPNEIKLQNHIAPELSEKLNNNGSDVRKIGKDCVTKQTTPLIIRIEYNIIDPNTGLLFSGYDVDKDKKVDKEASFLYTANMPFPGEVRSWLPCLDELDQRCTWELDFIVTQKDEPNQPRPDDGNEDNESIVVCCGELVSKDRLSFDNGRILFKYNVPFQCPAYLISFAIGRFQSTVFATSADSNPYNNFTNKEVMAYCPLTWSKEMKISCSTISTAMDFYVNEFGSYPFDTFTLIFLKSSYSLCVGSGVCIISTEFLHSSKMIDQVYETRRLLGLALSSQWFGANIVPKQSPDIWLITGLSGYMNGLFMKKIFGTNEYKYKLKKDMDKCVKLDTNRPPLFNSFITYPFDCDDYEFILLKSPLVMHLLSQTMIKKAATVSRGLNRLIPRVLTAAMGGDLGTGNTISTNWFLKFIHKVFNIDLRAFAEQWIYSSGCPVFSFECLFSRKKMVVEISMKQTTTNAGLIDETPESFNIIKPAKIFKGKMTVLIKEADGTPYEHVLDIQQSSQKYEVQFNTKYKRIRRSTKRFQQRKAESAAAEAIVQDRLDTESGTMGVEPTNIIDGHFLNEEGLIDQKRNWRIVEWGENDQHSLISAPYEWIRIDYDLEWIACIDMDQQDYMWAAQLEKDKDTASQFDSTQVLLKFPSYSTSTTLMRTIMNTQCFYQIRMECAYSLVECAKSELNYNGLFHLLKIYSQKFAYPLSDLEEDSITQFENLTSRPNDFSNFSDYFVKKALLIALSRVRDIDGRTPKVVKKLILNLLKLNDNSGNPYSDDIYVSCLVQCVGNILTTSFSANHDEELNDPLSAALINEFKRYFTLDCLIPSYRNAILVTSLQVYTKLALYNILPADLKLFLNFSRYGNYLHVRLAAIDGILLLGGLFADPIRDYLFCLIERDIDHHVRYYCSRSMAKVCAIGISQLDDDSNIEQKIRKDEDFVFEDMFNQNFPSPFAEGKLRFKEQMTKLQISRRFQDQIWALLKKHKLDFKIRNSLVIICKILYPNSSTWNLNSFHIRIPVDLTVISSKKEQTFQRQEITDISNTFNGINIGNDDSDTSIMETRTEQKIVDNKYCFPHRLVPYILIEKSHKKSKSKLDNIEQSFKIKLTNKPTAIDPINPNLTTMDISDLSSKDQYSICLTLLKNIMCHPSSSHFLGPISDSRIPTSTSEDKSMDISLGEIKYKVTNNGYLNSSKNKVLRDFIVDMELMFQNSTTGALINQSLNKEISELNDLFIQNKLQVFHEYKDEFVYDHQYDIPLQSSPVQNMVELNPTDTKISDQSALLSQEERHSVKKILKKMLKHESAIEFSAPVDPVAQGIPNYFHIVKHPIDLGTIKTKLQNDQYYNLIQVQKDIELVFHNCYLYNKNGAYVYNQARRLQSVYETEWRSAFLNLPPKIGNMPDSFEPHDHDKSAIVLKGYGEQKTESIKPSSSKVSKIKISLKGDGYYRKQNSERVKEYCANILELMRLHPMAYPFISPTKIRAVKKHMDLLTIQKKLEDDKYADFEGFDVDVKLLISNIKSQYAVSDDQYQAIDELENCYYHLISGFNVWLDSNYKDLLPEMVRKMVDHVASKPFVSTSVVLPTIDKKDPKELSLNSMLAKALNGRYFHLGQVESDIRIIVNSWYKDLLALNSSEDDNTKLFLDTVKNFEDAYLRNFKRNIKDKVSIFKSQSLVEMARSLGSFPLQMETKDTIMELLNKIGRNKLSKPFSKPVDAVTLGIPHYYKMIKNPMDIATIKNNLKANYYGSTEHIVNDFKAIVDNCALFNGINAQITQDARQLFKVFEIEFDKIIQ